MSAFGKVGFLVMAGIAAGAVYRLKNVWQWQPIARQAAHRYSNAPESVILAIIAKESSGAYHVTGDGGKAIGLMQMWEIAFRDVQENWPHDFADKSYADLADDPELQIMAGAAYLSLLRQRAGGNLLLALDGFNKGLSKASLASDYALDVMTLAAVQFAIGGFTG